MKTSYRTHNCGALTKKELGQEVGVCGWCQTRRDHGGVIFIDLRDRYGITQIVFNPDQKKIFKLADSLRREDVIKIKGKVRARPKGMENKNISTGEIEIVVSELKVLNKAKTPPLEVEDRVEANEEMRLKYRYLDLRRPIMQKRLLFRHKLVQAAKEFLNQNNFMEIETPLLVKSTPEGARDYLVPSRVNPGQFYALPQSPQLYKQMLMVAGFDRYYQIARCLRDEDLRQDRQPEHTQIDVEMSFMTAEEIREMMERLYNHIFKQVLGVKLKKFPILTYQESMDKYGTDKPDIRFDLFLKEVTEIVAESDFQVFKNIKEKGGIVKCINPEKEMSRKEIETYIDFCQENGAKGMAWMRVDKKGEKLESNIAKYFNEKVQKELIKLTEAKPGSTLMFIADKPEKCNEIISKLRNKLGKDLQLYESKEFAFCWITDFPLFHYNEEKQGWDPEHHMFTMPKPEFVDNFEKEPGKVLGDLWDLTLNGIELGSGSIRISVPELQERVMKLIGLSKKEAEQKFGFLLEAYEYGGPPHGGMGLGLDRLCALMQGFNDIREVIAFPKNKAAQCPMDESPSPVSEKQLKELHLKLELIKKGKGKNE